MDSDSSVRIAFAAFAAFAASAASAAAAGGLESVRVHFAGEAPTAQAT